MKILIVEDEPVLADETAAYLRAQGFICELARTVASADEKIHLYDYDIIVLDLMLPDGDGLTLLQTIKRRNTETGIIILSARNAVSDKIEGLEEGADDYLTKPFHLTELNARIQALIRRNIRHGDEYLRCGNIISNAIRHSEGSGTVHFQLDESMLYITNPGPPLSFPSEELFRRFRKGRSDMKTPGLGLAIVDEIVRLHDWQITYGYQSGEHKFQIDFQLQNS